MMKKEIYALLLALAASVCLAQEEPAPADAPEEDLPFMGTGGKLNWITEGSGDLGSWAKVDIPAGLGFINGSDTSILMEMFGNLPSEYEGSISSEDLNWTVLFQFADDGYVKDDEKDDLDAKKIMKTLTSGQEEGNRQRKEMGLDTLVIEGWAVEPKYNQSTNNLEWGTVILAGDGSRTVNYETRLLGRQGVMQVTLLCDPTELEMIMPEYQALLTGYAYNPGNTYAEYKEGDKMASYGLTALIAGGAAYGAAKTGLLGGILVFMKKLWYVVVAAVVAVWKGIKTFFARMTGTHE